MAEADCESSVYSVLAQTANLYLFSCKFRELYLSLQADNLKLSI